MSLVSARVVASSFVAPVMFAAAVFGAGFATRGLVAPETVATDPCGMPSGIALEALAPSDRGRLALRQLVCRDRIAGRISEAEYRSQTHALDDAFQRPAAPIEPVWASRVLGFSSQYTAQSWSAAQVLGPPDVYPAHGDQAAAWASLTADDADEWIEVGFDQPRAISAVQIFETFNPGAVAKVELVTTTGRRIRASSGEPHAQGAAQAKHVIDVQCTTEPIAAVRVDLASRQVPGWNELDAIGVVPCR